MASTTRVALSKTAWTQLAPAGQYLAVQLEGRGQIRVHVGDGAPAEDAPGLLLAHNRSDVPGSLSLGGLPEGTVVYARSISDDTENVIVLSY